MYIYRVHRREEERVERRSSGQKGREGKEEEEEGERERKRERERGEMCLSVYTMGV